jgi:Tol biopolymer transport system component
LAAASVLILASAVAVTLWRLRAPALSPPTVVQLTSERWAGAGSFSPDGTQIAYASAGEDGANWDIWLKIVGEAEARRLTTDPAAEEYPAWSPDGTQVAFLRYHSGITRGLTFSATGAIHLVSPLGGPARRLSDFPARLQLSWSPNGRWLAAAKARLGSDPPGGVFLISVATGEARPLTLPKPLAFDLSPSFSPDGRTLAYLSCEGLEGSPACDVYLQSVDSELRPQGAARPLTRRQLGQSLGLAWTRDGRSIVYGGLWRVPANGSAPPERLEQASGGRAPSSAGSRDRLVFVRRVGEADIYRLPLGGSPAPVVQSTFMELQPQYSPDGRRIALVSGRAGSGNEIWLADTDGANLARLTRGPGRAQEYPGWSPDARSIVFQSLTNDGHADVWTIGVDGSGLRQVTHDAANETTPSWSRDGRLIYFTSNRTGRFEIWRVAKDGGAEEQVTREGGGFPRESLDGQALYYTRGWGSGDGPLLSRPTAGGEERTILPASPSSATPSPRGLFFHGCGSLEAGISGSHLRFWDAATEQDRPVTKLQADFIAGLSVSPDGQSILYGRGSSTSDLMMIENFR